MSDQVAVIRKKFLNLEPNFQELIKRHWLASEAIAIGRGGIEIVHEATGASRTTIRAGINELKTGAISEKNRQRKAGGGRKLLAKHDKTLLSDLNNLIEPETRGDPENPLRWTCKSAEQIKTKLNEMGHQISERTVNRLLHEMGYSLQGNQKTLEGNQHPDRDQKFRYIERKSRKFLKENEPVISVDTKKKELVGQHKNMGKEWHPNGNPELVKMHDFPDPKLPKANPYGVFDINTNTGWVSIGTDHDTAEFAVETIRRWWLAMGRKKHPKAKKLLITADGGGSNGSRNKLWKTELQKLADELSMEISVCHFPPGTSKWNKIEHQMFSYISMNWRGRPLTNYETIVNLISNTTTKNGLKINCDLDESKYQTGIKITDEQMQDLRLTKEKFHGEWNYKLKPHECK